MIVFVILITLLALLFTGIPVFAGLTIYGAALLWLVQGGFGSVSDVIFHEVNQYLLVAIPLFGFMAHIMIKGRIVDDIYDTAYTFTRHLPGGLAIATILACALFAAISGSSIATAMTIGAVAIPQMLRFALPGIGNNWLVLLKSTAIVSMIGLSDMTRIADQAGRSTHQPFTFYLAVCVLYLAMTALSSYGLGVLMRRYSAGVRETQV